MFRTLKWASAACAVACLALAASPAQALEFGSSSTTGKSVLAIPLGFQLPIWDPVSLDLGVRLMPGLSDMLGAANLTPGATEVSSSLVDANLDVLYRIQLLDLSFPVVGNFTPTLYPYVGYRYFGGLTSETRVALPPSTAVSYSQLEGLDYGFKFGTDFPLGFAAHARAGLTTLTGGGWDARRNGTAVTDAGRVDPRGMTLPSFSVGASWSALNVIDLYAGYEIYAYPTALRAQTPVLADPRTINNSLYVGARILFFSI